jgi:hypothetical protein
MVHAGIVPARETFPETKLQTANLKLQRNLELQAPNFKGFGPRALWNLNSLGAGPTEAGWLRFGVSLELEVWSLEFCPSAGHNPCVKKLGSEHGQFNILVVPAHSNNRIAEGSDSNQSLRPVERCCGRGRPHSALFRIEV